MISKLWPICILWVAGCGGNTADGSTASSGRVGPASTLEAGTLDATATSPGNGDSPSNTAEASTSVGPILTAGDAGAATGEGGAPGEVTPPVSMAPGAPTIGGDGYTSIDAGAYVFVGYVSSYTGGSGSSIELTYGPTSFCAAGSVGVNSAYQSWAGAGFNVDQAPSSEGGTAASIPIDATELSLSFSNTAGSPLEIQLIDSSFRYWCYELTGLASPAPIPLSSFNSACWDGSGVAFSPGTEIQAIQLIVPGTASGATPFDFCFLGLVVQ